MPLDFAIFDARLPFSSSQIMTTLKTIFITFCLAIFTASAFAQQKTPSAAVTSFYKFDRTNSQDFTRKNIDARKKWFSAALYKLLLNELAREKAYIKKHPNDKPFMGEGFPFQPLDETCKVGNVEVHKELTVKRDAEDINDATVRAIFAFPRGCADPAAVTFTLEMNRTPAGWVIDNVIYDDSSNLVKDLKRKKY